MARRFTPEHIKRRRRRVLVSSIIVLFLGISVGGYFYYQWEASKPTWTIFNDSAHGLSIEYPSTFRVKTLGKEAREAGYLLEIKRDDPPALFNLRYEEGLEPLKLVKGTVFAGLVDAVNRRYPDRFPDYKKEFYGETILSNEKAAQFDFTYTGADGKTRVKQRLVIVVKDETAYYLSAQAPEGEFKKSEKDFAKIIESFEFVD